MLELVDESLEAFFRAATPLSPTDVDVSFEPPDREWSAKLTRPTVSMFLWDIRRSASRSQTGLQTTRRADGSLVNQFAPPVVELRYVVSAWASNHGDERALLGALLQALLRNARIPREYLRPAFDGFQEPQLVMARVGEEHFDVIKLLEGQLKPALNMVLVAEIDLGDGTPVAPAVTEIGTTVTRRDTDGEPQRRRRVAGLVSNPAAVGALVRSPTDAAIVNPAGQFLLRADEGDEIVIDIDPPLTARVPAIGGVVL